MSSKNINIRIDEELKEEADELFNELGLSLSAAIKIFIKQSLRKNGLPFEVSLNSDTEQAFSEIQNNNLETFQTLGEFWDDLNDED